MGLPPALAPIPGALPPRSPVSLGAAVVWPQFLNIRDFQEMTITVQEAAQSARQDDGQPRPGTSILSRIAGGKYLGCKLTWLTDEDLRDVVRLSTSTGFQHACIGILQARLRARRRRVSPKKRYIR